MFEDLKDKIKQLLGFATGFKKQSLEDLQDELLRAEVLKQVSDIPEINRIISEMAYEVDKIDQILIGQKVRTIEEQLEREKQMAKKECYIYLLNKFSIPDIESIKEEIKQYENK